MTDAPQRIVTARLVLRRWREGDVAALARLNADPNVMRFFPRTYSFDETRNRVALWTELFEERGFAPWAVELPGVADCIGLVGAGIVGEPMSFAGSIEMAWRLDRPFWGQGYALEAAHASLRDIFERVVPPVMIAYTARLNRPSRRVMEKLGMAEDASSAFDHPAIEPGNPLRPHVLYRVSREDFIAGQGG